MSEFVMMPKADYEAACNSIRAKTGKTELIKSGAMSTEIDSITGGGSSDDVRYVTFMSYDGTEEHGRLPVAVGYDCPNPKFTVTRESTAQYDFVHDAWATEPNGTTDANALKAVTEDRVVYATFISVLRYYTITFYDDDGATLPTTQSVAYGSTPSYTPTKDGYDFDGWEPALSAVTGDASYTAQWKVKAAFGTATWAEISAITTAGGSAGTFSVGDKRDEVLTYADGKTENIELVIAHILDDGTLCLIPTHALSTLKPMHSSHASCVINPYNNDLGKYLTGTVVPAFSEELSGVLKTQYIFYGNRQIALLSDINLCNITAPNAEQGASAATSNYDLLATQANRKRNRGKNGDTAVTYWTSTCNKTSSGYYYYDHIKTDGTYQKSSSLSAADGVTTDRGVVFQIWV